MPNTSSRTLKVRLDFLRVNRLIIRTTETTDRYRLCFKISIQMIVSFGVNVKPLALSPLSFFHWSNRMEEPTLLIEKSGGRFPGRGGGGATFHTLFISWAWVSIQSRGVISCILYFFCCNLAQIGNQTQSGTCKYTGLEVLQIAAILSWTSTEWSLLSISIGNWY